MTKCQNCRFLRLCELLSKIQKPFWMFSEDCPYYEEENEA